MARSIFVENLESDVLVNAVSVVLEDPTAAFGIREVISGSVVVAAGAAVVNTAVGVYSYDISALNVLLEYEAYWKITRSNGDIEFEQTLIPTASLAVLTAYIDEIDAQTYFDGRLNTEPWDNATSGDRDKALSMGTQLIDRLNFLGEKTDENQVLQFPRDADTSIPDDIQYACCECALALLDGVDPEMEFANLSMVSQGYSSVRSTYDRSRPAEYILAGIPSAIAWRYLKPYIRDVYTVGLDRVS